MNKTPYRPDLDRPERVFLYARVSSDEQWESGTIDTQIDFLRRLCEIYGSQVLGEYLDDGISGTISY